MKKIGSVNFVKTLKLVNATLKENYENFKLTQAQWDKSTTVTQKLKDRLEYLNEAYDIQKDKVTTLKIELEQLENAENKDKVAIQKKKAALTQAETSLQRYKNQIDETTNKIKTGSEAIKEYGEKIAENGEKIEKAGKKFTAFSVASAGALTASAKLAIDFESAFAGVEKTVDATDEQLAELKQGIRDMAKEIPSSTTEIAEVAEAAGQLGIETDNILSFSKAMIDLGNSTNLTSDEAASNLAKFANIMQMSQKDFDRLGSAIVDLGNHYATTEKDIVDMAMRIAGAGKQVGLSEGDVLGLATALSSVGIEAEMGGSAISKAMVKMQSAVEVSGGLEDVIKKTGLNLRDLQLMSDNDTKSFKELAGNLGMTKTELKNLVTAGGQLKDFASISGMTTSEFQKQWKEDATGAITAFIKGLGDTKEQGKSAITLLNDMGLSEVRLRDSLLRAANAGDLFNDAVKTGTKAWEDNTALTEEANKRYETLQSKMQKALNKIKDIGITLGNKLMPSIEKIIKKVEKWTEKFNKLNDEQVDTMVKLGLLVAGLAPVISIIGKTTTGIGKMIQSYGNLREGLGLLITKSEESGGAMTGLLKVIEGITSPVGIACIAIGAAITGIAIASNKANEEVKKDFTTMGNSATDFIKGIDNAKSHLGSFNSILFASAEEQQKLKENMDEVQKGITDICKKASDERRGYTQEEITQLDEYFTKLRELKDREIEIQSQIATAITQQAQTNAESIQGSLDEYKVQAQEWIKTAKEQKDATVKLIEQGTIEEVALLNQRYKTEEEKQSEAYKKEYDNIMQQKQEKIDAANDEVRKVSEVYTNGYLDRAKQSDSFYTTLQEFNKKVEKENSDHENKLKGIEDNAFLTRANKIASKESQNQIHRNNLKKIYEEMYKDMSDEQAEELGVWMGMLSQTELYGGKISDENQSMVDEIIATYDKMPAKTREAMKNAMTPMLEEMNKKEPTLFAKAKNIADGILIRLRKAFDEHSPSKKTRKIMKFAMQPLEEEMEKGKNELFKQADELGNGVVDRLKDIDGNVDLRSTNRVKEISSQDTALIGNMIDMFDSATRRIIEVLNKILEKSGNPIYLDSGALVGATKDQYDVEFANNQIKRERGN